MRHQKCLSDEDLPSHSPITTTPSTTALQEYARFAALLCHRLPNARTTLTGLLPSFLHPLPASRRRSNISTTTTTTTATTAIKIHALDGLRGICCLMVLHLHWTFAVTDSNDGGSSDVNTAYPMHRPFLYLLWAGTSHVNVFFVISGYVLSIKCLNDIHSTRSFAPVYEVIASSVLRRGVRIFLPPMAMLLGYAVAIQLGAFDKASAVFLANSSSHELQIRMMESMPPKYDNLVQQLVDVCGTMAKLVDPTDAIRFEYSAYDSHLWTIPTEFYCSMALYVVLIATCRLRTRFRLVVHAVLVVWCWLNAHQPHFLFFAGMTIAELDILLRKRRDRARMELPRSSTPEFSSSASSAPALLSSYFTPLNLLCTSTFILGLYLLSIPLLWSESTPGYATVHRHMPASMATVDQQRDAIRALGALLTTWPITVTIHNTAASSHPSTSTSSATPLLTALLCNPVATYLGKISFALYLVHGFVIRSLGYALLPTIYRVVISDPARRALLSDTPVTETPDQAANHNCTAAERLSPKEVAWIWILGYAVILPVTVCVADWFYRWVDVKCVRLGGWVERQMVRDQGDGSFRDAVPGEQEERRGDVKREDEPRLR